MEATDLLNYFLTKVLNKTEDEVKALIYEGDKIKDNAGDALLELDAARVNKIKETSKVDGTTYFNNGYKKAEKEVLSDFEKKFREKTGFESDLQGLDLVTAWGEAQKKIKVDDVKLHPDYLALERRNKETEAQWKARVDELTAGFEKEKKMAVIRDQAKKLIYSGTQKPVVPSSPIVAANIESVFLGQLNGYDYQMAEDGNHIVIKDGKRVEDAHGNPVTFDTHVRNIAASYYEFKKQEGKGNAGNEGGGGYQVGVIKTIEDFNREMAAAKTPKQRMEIAETAKKAGIDLDKM